MKLILVLALVAVANARPQLRLEERFPIDHLGEQLGTQPQVQPQPHFVVVQHESPQPHFVEVAPPVHEVEQPIITFVLSDEADTVSSIQEVPPTTVFVPGSFGQGIQRFGDATSHQFVRQSDKEATVISEDRLEPNEEGVSGFRYETSNGISHVQRSQPDANGHNTVKGSYRYTDPEGQVVEVYYEADSQGYRVQSDSLPTPPPMPAHALEQYLRGQELHRQAAERRLRDSQGQ